MANILIIGDPHLKPSSISLVERFLSWILDTIRTQKPDLVVILGDVFHTHNVVRSEIMFMITKYLEEALELVPHTILVGNHDMSHPKVPDIHAWIPFAFPRWPNLHIVDQANGCEDLYYIPYIDDPTVFQSTLDKAMRHQETNIIFCHQTFRGADFGFIKTKEGAPVPTDYDGLIVAGHIHKAQQLGPVWYPGTPFAQESTDHDETKGIYLLDSVSRKVTFLKSPLPQWVTVHGTIDSYESVIAGMNKNDRNHLVLTGSGPELTALMEMNAFRDLKREYGFSVKKQVATSIISKSVKQITSLEGAVVDYIDNIYQGAIDKEILKTQCLDALK